MSSSQGQFMVRAYTAKVLAMNISNIRVTPAEIGGGFGGKTIVYLEPLAVLLSKQSGRPVKMVMTREEVFRATGPTSGGVIEVKLGAKKDGTITAARAVLKFQAGAFPGSPVAAGRDGCFAMYDVPNFGVDRLRRGHQRAEGRGLSCPRRADRRLRHRERDGRTGAQAGHGPVDAAREERARRTAPRRTTGRRFVNIGYLETLQAARTTRALPHAAGPSQGRGVASGFWFNVGGESTAAVHVGEDGTVVAVTGNPDIGGSRASMAMMAAETLGITVENVRPIVADTASIGYRCDWRQPHHIRHRHGGDAGGREGGRAAQVARRADLGHPGRGGGLEGRQGDAGRGQRRRVEPLSIAAIALQSARTGGPICAEVSFNAQGAGPGFATHCATSRWTPKPGR